MNDRVDALMALVDEYTGLMLSVTNSEKSVHAALAAHASIRTALEAALPSGRDGERSISADMLTDKIASMLSGTYHCGRVWDAWRVGTMSESDFSPVDESDTPREIADEVIAMLSAPAAMGAPEEGEPKLGEPVVIAGELYDPKANPFAAAQAQGTPNSTGLAELAEAANRRLENEFARTRAILTAQGEKK